MPTIALRRGELYAIANPYEVDGRLTWHDPAARGFAPMNCYLLTEGDSALLIDTGLTVHRDALVAQLRELVDGAQLEVFHTRLGEYTSVCNTPAIVDAFDVPAVWGQHPAAELWTDFQPHRERGFGHAIAAVRVKLLERQLEFELGDGGRRRLEAFSSILRLLPTWWLWDEATRTMFTSDLFSHVRRPTARGPWVVTAEDDDTTVDTVREHMVGTRYWWVPEADMRPIADGLAEVFASHPVERVAPQYGCILEGATVVERHLAMVQQVLA
jgi:flavorubredoxin